MNKSASKYYKEVYHMFPEHGEEEKDYLQQFKNYIERYDQQFPHTTYSDYIELFGEPQEIVSSYYFSFDNMLIIEKMKAKKVIKIIFTIFLIFFILFSTWISYMKYQEYQLRQDGSVEYSETTIEEVD